MLSSAAPFFPSTAVDNFTPNISYSPPTYYAPKKRLDKWRVCQNFLDGSCAISESECELAHPTPGKEVKDGIVTVCMDYVNDQCKRANCKYLHPSQHICDQIHDHKKKPHLALRTRSLSNSSDTGFSNSTEDFFHPQVQLPYPMNMYYPNPHHPTAYFFPRAPLSISGQGIGSSYSYQQNPEYQYSSETHDRGDQFRSKLSRSVSYSGLPALYSSIPSPYQNQLSTASEISPSDLHIAFPSSQSSSLSQHSTDTLPANLISISLDTDSLDTQTTEPLKQ